MVLHWPLLTFAIKAADSVCDVAPEDAGAEPLTLKEMDIEFVLCRRRGAETVLDPEAEATKFSTLLLVIEGDAMVSAIVS